jgi:hypothetical protein
MSSFSPTSQWRFLRLHVGPNDSRVVAPLLLCSGWRCSPVLRFPSGMIPGDAAVVRRRSATWKRRKNEDLIAFSRFL